MNIKSNHKFNRSGDAAYGCINRLSLVEYQIGVIGGNEMQSKKHTGNNYDVILKFKDHKYYD